MAGLGNPLSFELGGGPSPQEQVYDAMYQNVGDGIQSQPDSLVEKWRRSRARGIAATQLDDRAATQAFPDLSTDYLPVWEDILKIPFDPGASEAQRQATVLAEYTRTIDATFPKLDATLQGLDPLLNILQLPHDLTRVTVPGRGFEDWNPAAIDASGPPFNLAATGSAGDNATGFPNFSDDFILFMLYDIGVGIPSAPAQRTMVEAQEEMNESLPAWVDFRLFTVCGFILDQDLLDITALCDGVIIGP